MSSKGATAWELIVARTRAKSAELNVSSSGRNYGAATREHAQRLAEGLIQRGNTTAWVRDVDGVVIDEFLRDMLGFTHHLDFTAGTVDGRENGVYITFGDPTEEPKGYFVAFGREQAGEVASEALRRRPDLAAATTSDVNENTHRGLALLDLYYLDTDNKIVHADMSPDAPSNDGVGGGPPPDRGLS